MVPEIYSLCTLQALQYLHYGSLEVLKVGVASYMSSKAVIAKD